MTSKGQKIFLWLGCSVLCALLPILINYNNGRVNGEPPHWIDLLAGGELLLISAALAADAIGSVFQGGERFRPLRITCGVGCLLLLLVTSIYFGRIAFSMEKHRTSLTAAIEARDPGLALRRLHEPEVDRSTVAHDSLWLFLFTGVCSLGAKLVEEE